jgi:hypothetical protein
MSSLAQLLSTKKENLFQYETKDGKSLKLGLHFLYPFIKNKKKWPYKKDVMYWDDWPTKQPFLLFGGLQLDNKKYINLFRDLPAIADKEEILRNMPVRYPLLWIVK